MRPGLDPRYMAFVLGLPILALIACVRCRRHRPLLWVGRTCVVLVLGSLWVEFRTGQFEGTIVATELAGAPLLVAGIVLLIGGVVRWGVARAKRER